MNCTINDIATALNLSRNTVSKVLNGKPGVSENTKKLILEAASKMKYGTILQSAADEEIENKGTIVLLTKNNAYSGFWMEVMQGIKDAMEGTGYTSTIGIITNKEIENCQIPTILYNPEVKGIILVEICNISMCKKILDLDIPVVSVDMPKDAREALPKLDVVTMENKKNVRQLVNILIEKGCRKFSFAGDLSSSNVGEGFIDRYSAFVSALEVKGLKEMKESSMIDNTCSEFRNPIIIANKIRTLKELPNAYICGNDRTAMQLINALTFCGYSVPKDVLVAGFDNIPESANLLPPLTTIATPKHLLGEQAVSILLNKIKNPERDSIYLEVATRLVLRESTATK